MLSDPSSYQSIGWLSLATFAVAGGVNQLLAITDRIKGKPPAEQLASSHLHLSRRFDSLEKDVQNLRVEIKRDREETARENDDRRHAVYAKIEAMRLELKQDAAGLQEKVSAISSQVTGLETAASLLTQRALQIDQKLDRFIERRAA